MSPPANSRVVIVGVDHYTSLAPLPSVAPTVKALAALFRAGDLWGLGAEQYTVVSNPRSPQQLLDAVHEAATAAQDSFLFYFAGHGLLSPSGDLFLALPDSDTQRLYRAVAYDEIRRLINRCRATRKVVILDCCYSGRALLGHMGEEDNVAQQAAIDGTYLMTAAAETKRALAPPDERYTAFTGEIIEALVRGIPKAANPITADALYWHVRQELAAKSRPLPQQRARNAGHCISLLQNRWQVERQQHPDAPDSHITSPILPLRESASAEVDAPMYPEQPSRQRSPRRAQLRDVALSIVTTIVIAGSVVYWLGPGSGLAGSSKGGKSNASVSPSESGDQAQDPVSDTGKLTLNTHQTMRLEPCESERLAIEAHPEHDTFIGAEPVKISVSIRHDEDDVPCRVNLARTALSMSVDSTGEFASTEWSSSWCNGYHDSRWVTLDPQVTITLNWDRMSLSKKTCQHEYYGSVWAGTYMATVRFGTLQVKKSFTLKGTGI
ncbi:caspase domain-containing protein [Streptomyces sp. NPDC101175]|uniref:caspase family protein n=1 Tax=Streptomyces sp. NPDC101175 TaxID=3366123 RepID=UPI003838F230